MKVSKRLFNTADRAVIRPATGSAKSSKATRTVAALVLASVASCSVLSLDGCKGQNVNFGPSGGEIAGIIIGAAVVVGGTTAILVHVNHSHHQVKGCVSSSPNGLQLQTDDKRNWLLTGNTPEIKAGDLVKLNGTKLKRPKHSTGDPTFEVEKINKDFGPCRTVPATTANISPTDSTPAGK